MTATTPLAANSSAKSPINKLMMEPHNCPLCKTQSRKSEADWAWQCKNCKFEFSDLWNEEIWARKTSELDETSRFDAIRSLRRFNARKIFAELGKYKDLNGKTVLDIGCGYGWFLDESAAFNVSAIGIEPEQKIADVAIKSGHKIIVGCFPDCVSATDKYDVLTFNDVLEHIPDPESVIDACSKHLNADGLLSITIPSSTGIFYRISKFMAKCGFEGSFERMWQKQFHSPHVSYFNDQNLKALVERNGFTIVHEGSLPTLESNDSLWNRLTMDKSQSIFVAAVLWIGIKLAMPILKASKPDIIFHIYKINP